MDSWFFDQKIFKLCEKLDVGYVCGGKIYKDIKSLFKAVRINAAFSRRATSASSSESLWNWSVGSKTETASLPSGGLNSRRHMDWKSL
jgi:hypothetical protein